MVAAFGWLTTTTVKSSGASGQVQPVQNASADQYLKTGGTVVEFNRRDMVREAAAIATAGLLTLFGGAGNCAAAPRLTLKMGSRGSEVLVLQCWLTSLGYWLDTSDGQLGDLTRQSVVAIQKFAGLARDGVCGPVTWSCVESGKRPHARSVTGHVIDVNKTIQTLLIVDSVVVKRISVPLTPVSHGCCR